MAKFLLTMLFAGFLAGCNNNGGDEVEVEYNPDSPATQYRGVQNANGNIPDSSTFGSEPMSNSADSGDIDK